jgi:endonuclease/exonuclease/phosphatase family protein
VTLGGTMRIATWNCNMAFRRKFAALVALQPDLAIIPECEAAQFFAAESAFKPRSAIWIGDNPRKGLGVFTFGAFRARRDPIHRPGIPYVLPLRISGPVKLRLLAVWACHHKPNSYENRVGPLRRALRDYDRFCAGAPLVVAGDFNNNVHWDRPGRPNNHEAAVQDLDRLGLASAYHVARGVAQGAEPEPTLYWRDRRRDGPVYHIDYCFVPRRWTTRLAHVTVGGFDEWVGAGLSDHVPLMVEIAL